ncbi:hypothetical protein D9X30_5563 [Cupriavidus sp. U2]|uniref:hypothetical protein n=1 Tax=Cupriavidus sp. U2 TaxID=2920269 RepID=UPI00129DAA2C|nr:hypothetical protein [Cupriavidus sp. U2]KAI3589980.1 hypothetical protein D9X30_5563 [Cupriavidus sp. U2]
MSTLTILDLSSTTTLEANRMQSVRGGLGLIAPWTSVYAPVKLSFDSHVKIDQQNQQMQQVGNYFGNGSAFQDHLRNNATTNQYAQNNA